MHKVLYDPKCSLLNIRFSFNFAFLLFWRWIWNVNLLGTVLHWYDPIVSKHSSFSVQVSVPSMHSLMLTQSAAWLLPFRANPTSQIHIGSSLKYHLVLQFYLLVLQHSHKSWARVHRSTYFWTWQCEFSWQSKSKHFDWNIFTDFTTDWTSIVKFFILICSHENIIHWKS